MLPRLSDVAREAGVSSLAEILQAPISDFLTQPEVDGVTTRNDGRAVTVQMEGTVEILRHGDPIHFASTRVHSTWNHTDRPVPILWRGTMGVLVDGPGRIHNGASVNGADSNIRQE